MNHKLSFYFTILIYSLFSQSDYKNVNFERNFFQPEAWAMPGYPEPGVGKHGHFNTTIPITSISSRRGTSVNLSLNYSSDITFAQKSGWLGMGWSYNAGVITRSVSGGFVAKGHASEVAGGAFLPEYVDFPTLMSSNNADKFRDIYYLTLPNGRTVEFLYPENELRSYVNKAKNSVGKMAYGYKVHEFASVEGNYIIEGLYDNNAITVATETTKSHNNTIDDYKYFLVTDEAGIKYIYGNPTLATINEYSLPAVSGSAVNSTGRPTIYANTWRILALTSVIIDKSDNLLTLIAGADIKYQYSSPVTLQKSFQGPVIQQSYLEKIYTADETIDIELLSRVDFNSSRATGPDYQSSYIKKVKKSVNTKLTKEFEFNYTNNSGVLRYYLESILDKSSGKTNSVELFATYKFTYHSTDKLHSYIDGNNPIHKNENLNGYYRLDPNAGQIASLSYPTGRKINVNYETVDIQATHVPKVKIRVVGGALAAVTDDHARLSFQNNGKSFKYSRVKKLEIKTQGSQDFIKTKEYNYKSPFLFGLPKNAFSKYDYDGNGPTALITYKKNNGSSITKKLNSWHTNVSFSRKFDSKVYYESVDEIIDGHTKIHTGYTTRNDVFMAEEVYDTYTILVYGQSFIHISPSNYWAPYKGQVQGSRITDLKTNNVPHYKNYYFAHVQGLEPLLSLQTGNSYLGHNPYNEGLNYYRSYSAKVGRVVEYKDFKKSETSYEYDLLKGIILRKSTRHIGAEGLDPSLGIKSRSEVTDYTYAFEKGSDTGTDIYSKIKKENLVNHLLQSTSNLRYEKNGEPSYENPVLLDSVKASIYKTLNSKTVEYSFFVGTDAKLKLSGFHQSAFEWLRCSVKVHLSSTDNAAIINYSYDDLDGSGALPADKEINISAGSHKIIIVLTGNSLPSSNRGRYEFSFNLTKQEKLKFTAQTKSELTLYKAFNENAELKSHKILPYKSYTYRGLPNNNLVTDYNNLTEPNWLMTKEIESVNFYALPTQIKFPGHYERIYYSSDKGQNNPTLDDDGYMPTAKVISMNNNFTDAIDIKTTVKYNSLNQVEEALNNSMLIKVDYDKHHRIKSIRKNGSLVQENEYFLSSTTGSYNPATPNSVKNTTYYNDSDKLVSVNFYNGHLGLIQSISGNNKNFRISEPIHFEKSLNTAESNVLHMIDRDIAYQPNFIHGKVSYINGISTNSLLYQQQDNTDLQGKYPYTLSLRTVADVRTEAIPPGKHPIENRSLYRSYRVKKKTKFDYDEHAILEKTEYSDDDLMLKTSREKGAWVFKNQRSKKFNENMPGELSFQYYNQTFEKKVIEYDDKQAFSPQSISIKFINLATSAETSITLTKSNRSFETAVLEPGDYKILLTRPEDAKFTVGIAVKGLEYEKLEDLSEIKYSYDSKNNLLTVVHPDLTQTSNYEYDHKNQLIKKTLPSQNGSYKYKYDKFGRLRFTKDPNGNFLYTKYDNFGRTIETGIYNGSTTFINADPESNFPGSNTESKVQYFYDSPYLAASQNNLPGKLAAKVEGNTVTYYSYNSSGLVEWMEEKESSTSIKKFSYSYDRLGNIISTKSYILGNLIDTYYYAYDIFGQLTELKKGNEILATYSYNPDGSVKSLNLGQNLQKMDYSYNPRGWLTDINKNLVNNDQFQLKLRYYNNDVSTKGISQNYNGNISYLESNRFDGNRFIQLRTGYKYDAFNRLLESFSFGSNNNRNHIYDTSYSYDIMGNITNLSRKGVK